MPHGNGSERRGRSSADAASQQAAAATQQAAVCKPSFERLKAKQTDRGMVLTLGDVLFDTGRAELNPGAATQMDQLRSS